MSDYLKKRKRSENKFDKNKKGENFKQSKGFGLKYSRKSKGNEFDENINYNMEPEREMVSEDMIKIGKFWDGKSLIEPKNTAGKLYYLEGDGDSQSLTFSQVGDSLYIMNSEDFSVVNQISQNEETIVQFTVNPNPNNTEVIMCMGNSLVRVFDLNNPTKCKKVWKLNKEVAKIMKVDATFKFLAIATSLNHILIYDTTTYKLLNSFSGHTGYIYDIAFNPDKEKFLIYSASEDGTVKVWDIILNKCVGSLEDHSNGVRLISLTNDGKSLISVTTDNNINIWKLTTKESNTLIKTIPFENSITSILYFTRSKVNKDNSKELTPTLLLGCEDGALTELNLKTGKFNSEKSVRFTSQPLVQIFYSTIFAKMYLLTSDQTIIHLNIDLVNQDVSHSSLIKMYPGYCQELLDLKIIPSDDLKFLFSSNDNTLKYYQQIESNIVIKEFQGHEDFIMNIDIKDDYISTSSKDNTVRIWKYFISEDNEFNCECIAVLKGHSESVNSSALIVKKGNKKVVTGSKDMYIKVWDFSSAFDEEGNTSKENATIKQSLHSELAHDEEINLVRISPNEKMIASGSYDKKIKIWSTDLKLMATISGHKRAVTDLSFSKYAKLLASSSTDKTIKIWNLNDFSCMNTFEGHLASVLKVQWVYFGTHIISGGADGLVKFWNLKTSECLNTINAHEGKIWALDVNPKENPEKKTCQFITGATDSKVLLWTDITSEKETETLHKEEDTILKKEKLRLLNDNKEYYEALNLSLELNHRNDFMNILKNFITDNLTMSSDKPEELDHISLIINNRKSLEEEGDKSNDTAVIFKENLQKILKDKELKKIVKSNLNNILEITRDNNIKASTFLYVQILLKLILISHSYEVFINDNMKIALGRKNKKLKTKKAEEKDIDYLENFNIIKSYSEKHLERINREIIKSYLVDFVLEKMKIV